MQCGNKKSSLGKLIAAYETNWKVRLTSNLVLLGLVYGYISALHNQNPYYPVPENALPEKVRFELNHTKLIYWAYDWRPSPFWFPSYLLCKLPPGEPGIGIFSSKSGYLFRSYAGLYLYRFSSTILGGVMGLILAKTIIAIKALKQRKKQTKVVA
jgi:hypothetical protein